MTQKLWVRLPTVPRPCGAAPRPVLPEGQGFSHAPHRSAPGTNSGTHADRGLRSLRPKTG